MATPLVAGVGLYAWQVEPHWLEFVRRPLPIRHLPAGLVGRKLVQISDLHIGPRVSDAYVLTTFDRIRDLGPDLVAYTGDFVSFEANLAQHAERMFARLPTGKLGTVGILGNHDYGLKFRQPEVATRITHQAKAAGVEVLRNRSIEIAGLQVVGMDDLWAGEFDPARAFAGTDPKRARIVLSHNPDTVDDGDWVGYEGWILSGHTHGGQCKPPFLPPPLLPVRNRRYTRGEFDLGGGRRLYISRGVGHLLQARFNVRPEVTLFELQSA